MKRFLLVGRGIGGSLSPALHNEMFRRLGIAAEYGLLDVGAKAFDETVAAALADPDLAGINVTAPYKGRIVRHLAELDPAAARLATVNCAAPVVVEGERRWIGHNTDAGGFGLALREVGDPAGLPVAVIGAGGGAAAAAFALLEAGALQVRIWNRTHDRANSLAVRLLDRRALAVQHPRELAGAEWVVHATPARPPAVPDVALADARVYIDLNYRDLDPGFIARLTARGCRTADGIGMLIAQAALSYEFWFAMRPPIDELRDVYYNYIRDSLPSPQPPPDRSM